MANENLLKYLADKKIKDDESRRKTAETFAQIRANQEYEKLRKEYEAQQAQQVKAQQERDNAGVLERLGSTVMDIPTELLGGLGKGVEGVADAIMSIWNIPGNAGYWIEKLIGDDQLFENAIKYNATDEWWYNWEDDLTKQSYINDAPIVKDVVRGIGQQLPTIGAIAAAPVTGGMSLAAVPYLQGAQAVSAGGQGVEEALNDGADFGQAFAYGTMQGGMEYLLEKIPLGTGKIAKTVVKEGTEAAAKSVGKNIGRNMLEEALQETIQEGASAFANPATKSIYKGEEAFQEYANPEFYKDVAYQALVGGITGGLTAGASGGIAARTGIRAAGGKSQFLIQQSAQELNALDTKEDNLRARGKFDTKQRADFDASRKAETENISAQLKSMDEATRKKVIQDYGLRNDFTSEGDIIAPYAQEGEGGIEHTADTGYKPSKPRTGDNREAFSASLRNTVLEVAPTNKPLTEAGTAAKNIMTKLGKVNNRTRFVITEAGEYNGHKFDAFYDNANDVIYVNNNADPEAVRSRVMVHEITHTMEGTKAYDNLIRYAKESGLTTKDGKTFADLVAEAKKDYAKTVAGKTEGTKQYVYETEAMANLMGELLSNERSITRLAESQKGTAYRIYSWVKNAVSRLAKSGDTTSAEYKALRNIEKLYAKAMSEAAGGLSLSDVERYFKEFAEKEEAGETKKENVATESRPETGHDTTEATPSDNSIPNSSENVNTQNKENRYSLANGENAKLSDLENSALKRFGKTYNWNETGYLLIDGSKLDFSGKHEGARGGYRTVDHRDISDVYEESGESLSGNEAMVDFMAKGNIRISPEGNGINLSVAPTKAQEYALSDFISRARGEVTLDLDNTEGKTLSSTEYPKGTHSSKVINDIKNYFKEGTIPEVSDTARFRYSLQTDNTGKKLTEAQAEFFKDSKVRDKQGRLMVVYHGTNSNNEYTVFDTYGSNFGLFGQGSYFTENKDIAQKYTKKSRGNNPRVYEAYLDIRNPIDMDAKADMEAWEQFAENQEIAPEFRDNMLNKEAYRAVLNALMDEGYYKSDAMEAVWNMLHFAMGYDGLTHIGGIYASNSGIEHRVWVAYESEQIKLTTNENPTSNPDIRYSLQTDSEGKKLTEAQAEFFKDSKVRDEQGRLLEVYHGTKVQGGKFTVFDNHLNWFTADESYAERYAKDKDATGRPKKYKAYLNVKNPFNAGSINYNIYSEKGEASTEVIDIAKKLKVAPEEILSIGKDIDATYVFQLTNSKQFADLLKKNGYDGVIAKEGRIDTYATLDSAQIKSVDNKNPTGSEDIRYSLNDEKVTELSGIYDAINKNYSPAELNRKNLIRADFIKKAREDGFGYAYINNILRKNDIKIMSREEWNTGIKEVKNAEVLTEVPERKVDTKEKLTDAALNAQINFTNAQAGIESYLKKNGVSGGESKTNYVRAASNAAADMLGDSRYTEKDGKFTRSGKGLKAIFDPVYKKGDAYTGTFFEYLLHYHNIDRMAQEKPVFGDMVTAEDSKNAVAELEKQHPEFKTLAKEVWAYSDFLLQYRLDHGLITADGAAAMRKMYPHYVPTFRDTEGALGTGGLKGKYNVAVKSTVKTASGSSLDILPLDVMMARQTMETVKAGRVNELAALMHDTAKAKGDYTDVEVLSRKKLDDLDIDYSQLKDKQNEVSFFQDGKRVTMKVTPEIFEGFKAFQGNMDYSNIMLKASEKVNNTFKKLVTAWNPFFLVRNFFRDLQEGLFYTKHGTLKFTAAMKRAAIQIKNNGEYWQRYKAAGGLSSSIFDFDKGVNTDTKNKAAEAVKKTLGKIEYANIYIEQLPRLAEFMLSIDKGASIEQALLDSADVTTNFGRSGKATKFLNRTLVPFLNPSVQGMSKLWRTVTGRKTATEWAGLITKALILGVALTALNDLLNEDDEDYEALNMRDKENYYLIKVGDTFLKIPKGRVISVFGSLYLRGKAAVKGEEKPFDGYLQSVASAVTPADSATRTIFSPFFDLANNKTWYGGEIEGRKFDNTAPKDRHDESTSSIAVAIGKAINYSPKKIHYLIDQYSGVIGDLILPATTPKAERNIVASNFTIDPVLSNKYSDAFYTMLDEANYAKTAGDINAALRVRFLNSVAGEVSDMYRQKQEIEKSGLSGKEKLQQSKAVQLLINQTFKSAAEYAKTISKKLDTGGLQKSYSAMESSKIYASLDPAGQKKAAGLVADYYYSVATHDFDGATENKLYLVAQGVPIDKLAPILAKIAEFESDKDRNGNAISGSLKAKIQKFIQGLNLTAAQKYMIMGYLGYVNANGASQVKGYINGLKLSKTQKETLYEMSGYKLKSGAA